jgi:hypothetical protein
MGGQRPADSGFRKPLVFLVHAADPASLPSPAASSLRQEAEMWNFAGLRYTLLRR